MSDNYTDRENNESISNGVAMALNCICTNITIVSPSEGSLNYADISCIFKSSKLRSLSLIDCAIDDEFVKAKLANIRDLKELCKIELGNIVIS